MVITMTYTYSVTVMMYKKLYCFQMVLNHILTVTMFEEFGIFEISTVGTETCRDTQKHQHLKKVIMQFTNFHVCTKFLLKIQSQCAN